jgi:hypothetical protein
LSNPLAALITVPVQYNHDEYGGLNAGARSSRLYFQPVVPFSLNEDWNLITRTIIPLADQQGFPIPAMNVSGLGDITASQFFSPKKPTAGGWIWGVGPIEVLPTASEDSLGTGKWGLGPTFVILRQKGPWTVGYLGAHIWSVAGDDDRADVNHHAAVLQLYHQHVYDPWRVHGSRLRLERQTMAGSVDCPGGAIVQNRITDNATCRGRKILGQCAG